VSILLLFFAKVTVRSSLFGSSELEPAALEPVRGTLAICYYLIKFEKELSKPIQ